MSYCAECSEKVEAELRQVQDNRDYWQYEQGKATAKYLAEIKRREAADSKVKELEIVKTALQKNIAGMDESRLEMDKNYGAMLLERDKYKAEAALLEAALREAKKVISKSRAGWLTTSDTSKRCVEMMVEIDNVLDNKIAREALEVGKGE